MLTSNDAIPEGVHMAAPHPPNTKQNLRSKTGPTDAVFPVSASTGIAASVNWARDFVSEPAMNFIPKSMHIELSIRYAD